MKLFVLAQHAQQAAELAGGARAYAQEVGVIALDDAVAATPSDQVFKIALPSGLLLEDAADTIVGLLQDSLPDAVLCEPTRQIKLLAGKIAARLGTSVLQDILSFASDATVEHLVYGGAAIRTEKACAATALIMVPSGVLGDTAASGSPVVSALAFVDPAARPILLSSAAKAQATVNLPGASRVLGIGRGITAEDDLAMVRRFAQVLGAEVGCTRPIAEEEKWLPREVYIGVSGVMLTPDVYVAVGLSGQVQHTVGINRSKTIIAINKDKNAPIFKQADYGIVGDLYKIVPGLIEALGD